MERLVSHRGARMHILTLCALITRLAACQHTPNAHLSPASIPSKPSLAGHAIGDSLKFSVGILTLDRTREIATVFVRRADNVIVLAVIPGRDIEVIFPGNMTVQKLSAPNTFRFGMQRFEVSTRPVGPEAEARARQAYDQCQMRRVAELRRAAAASRAVRRDSTGKSVGAPVSAERESPPVSCDLLGQPAGKEVFMQPLPPREPRERYLVVLSSSSPVTELELNERLSTLTTIASDVSLTIEAIAAGIYAGKIGAWGGSYVSW